MDQERLASHVAGLVDVCKSHRDEQSGPRELAQNYYNGEMPDMPAEDEFSSVTSNDVRSVMKKVLPSITRTILSNDKVVEYQPVGQEDEEGAQQATDYMNYVVVPECGAEQAIFDAIHDACLLKTGILKWSAYTNRKAIVQDYTDQPDDAVLGLAGDPDNEMIDHVTSEETDPDVLALDPNARRHSFKLKRIEETTDIRLEAVPRGSFLISPGAESIEDAELTGEEQVTTRTALVAMGYDKELVWSLASSDSDDDGEKEDREGEDYSADRADTQKALQEVQIYEVYVKMDSDDDGIAECHRIVYGDSGEDANGKTGHVILGNEIVSEPCYADIVIERDPHQFDGHSIYEDVRDVQRVKTSLLRATLDNLYAQNDMRPSVDVNALEDPDGAFNGGRFDPIWLKSGTDVNRAIQWQQVPFMANHSFQMLGYMDEVAKDRTGITDASGGVDPEAFQNTSATAAQLMSESGIAQADAIVRSVARGGLRKAFRGLLKLHIAHADQPRTVRLKGEWVEYDPRTWNTGMDCTINVGLGGGTKERDLSTLQIILSLQKELLASLGASDNPFVKPDQLYNTLARITETAGFPSADPFFTEPDMEQIEQKVAQAAQKPNPEMQKLQAQMQLEDKKMQVNTAKESAQMEADLKVKQAEIQARTQENAEKLALQREQDAQKAQIELAKIEADLVKHREKLAADAQNAALARMPVPDYIQGGL